MRKTVFTIAALSLASLVSGGAAWAANSQGQGAFIKGTLTVQFVAGQECAAGDTACTTCVANNSFFVDAQGIAETTLGPLFAKVLKCSNPNPTTLDDGTPAPYGGYAGVLTLSLNSPPITEPSLIPAPKDVLTLTYAGLNTDAGDFYGWEPFKGTLTVESGTGKFQGARGQLTFIAQGGPPFGATEFGASTSPFSLTGNAFYLFQGTIQGISQ